MDEIKQLQMQVQELSQNVATLLLSNQSKDETIKRLEILIDKLEKRIEKLESRDTQNLILFEKISNKIDGLSLDMNVVKEFIDEQRNQPRKDLRDFVKQVIGVITSLGIGALFAYLGLKK